MSGYVQTNQPIVITNTGAAITISAVDTGKVFLIGIQAQATTAMLPAAAPGLHYKFIRTGNSATQAFNFIIAAPGTLLHGVIANVIDGLSDINANTSIAFSAVAVHGQIGDTIDMYCDGTNWSVLASGQLTTSFILA